MIYTCYWNGMNTGYSHRNVPNWASNPAYADMAIKDPRGYGWVTILKGLAGQEFNQFELTATLIKKTDDSHFIFIVTNHQKEAFDAWLTKYDLRKNISYEIERGFTNHQHHDTKRNLFLYVLASDNNIWRDLYAPEEIVEEGVEA